jgi:two-component system, LuxR family, sensor kinase FixL
MPLMRATVDPHGYRSVGDEVEPQPRQPDRRPIAVALTVGLMYYGGAKIGLALTFMPFPLSVLWPPNALLFAALLLAPTRWWWLLLLGALPAHLLAELQAKIPTQMVLAWFVSNVSEALIGALIVRRFSSAAVALRTVRSVLVFCVAAVTAALLSSFLDAGLVRLIGWGNADFWTLWQSRVLTNTVATLIFVPVVVTCAMSAPTWIRQPEQRRVIEAAVLLAGLLVVGAVVFGAGVDDSGSPPSLLYLPLPFLVWAALRFGPPLTSLSFAVVAFLVIWGAGHGHGPFSNATTHDDALPIQLFLVTIGVPLMLLAALIDERRHGERQLRASQELFSTAFRAGPDAIAVIRRRDGTIIEANDCWLDLFGDARDRSAQKGGGAPPTTNADDADRESLAALLRKSPDVRGREMALRDRDGAVREALVSITAVELGGEPCAIGIVHDITELRRAEGEASEQGRQLTHLTRVASLADFSSTLAHELNQPLTAILSNAQAALRFLARDPPDLTELRSILVEIADADKRAGLLIYHLRRLTKRGDEAFIATDLNAIARDALAFAHGAFVSGGVDVSTSLAPDLPQVSGDPVQLQQLLLNLISNACDAMQGQNVWRRKLSVASSRGEEGRVQIIVSDTGPGIAADQLESTFEPFFTTKVNGLGLGLPICRKIARAHGGTLAAQSREGDGASFRLVLPALPVATHPSA